jgi:uncharacterized protein with HEPN domain
MGRRTPQAPLHDMAEAADAVAEFLAGESCDSYATNRLLRSAVERQLTIVGEAMRRLLQMAPQLAARIDRSREVVAFRNVLAHGYDTVVPARVWEIATADLPVLRQQAAELLAELNLRGDGTAGEREDTE